VVSVLAVPGLVRSAVGSGISGAPDLVPTLGFSGAAWLVALAGQCVLMAAVIVAAGVGVRRQARMDQSVTTQ